MHLSQIPLISDMTEDIILLFYTILYILYYTILYYNSETQTGFDWFSFITPLCAQSARDVGREIVGSLQLFKQ